MRLSQSIIRILAALLSTVPRLAHAEDSSQPDGLLPKAEIGALRFLQKHPEYDGRGVIIAIFDTGVDPGAAGLQTTPDGRPKILDVIDGSNAGDVDTSTVVEAVDGKLTGLSGRSLRMDSGWTNPSGKFRLGLKAGYDFYPEGLVERMKARRRENWEKQHRPLEAGLQKALIDWKASHPQPTDQQRLEQKDLEVRLEQLRELDRTFEDPGPVFDCVVFHDGSVWRAVVDTDEDGDLADEIPLTNFRAERRYATFGGEELLNFAVNIFQDGNLLSIVTDSGVHGAHVAGIAAAYFPDQPDLNGIAPGAQIISVKTGPNRLRGGNMETGEGIVRGIAAVREHRCDILSASFGEPSGRPNQGRLIEHFTELVQEDGVIFVAAAHNLGPGLSTVAAPGGNSAAAIGVGAYLSPAMMERQRGSVHTLPETLFHFSSRGPTADGAWGVSICAPGSAASPVPNWTLGRHTGMAGTSMATPSVSGAVALVVSGLKAEKCRYDPWSIRRALENSARPVPDTDVFGQGRGLIQVDAAFDLSRQISGEGSLRPRFETMVIGAGAPSRGIYLREPHQARSRLDSFVWVRPVFPKSMDNRQKLAYEGRFRIQSTQPWVRTGDFMFLSHGVGSESGGAFGVAVDPTGLQTGLHTAEILGFEEGRENLGPAFRLPVTVIRPHGFEPDQPKRWRETIALKSGDIERRFFAVPAGSTWAELRLRPVGPLTERQIMAQAVQLVPGRTPHRTLNRWFFLQNDAEETRSFRTTEGRTLELVLASGEGFTHGRSELEVTLEFRGIVPGTSETVFDGSAQVLRVEATSGAWPSRVEPKATLRTRRRSILPASAECRPLSQDRDRLPDHRLQHRLVLDYPFALDEPTSVIPRIPALFGRLYDGEFESQIWMLFDGAKRLVALGDLVWDSSPVPLEKGPHTLRIQIRHERPEWLEKLKTLPLQIDQELPAELTLASFLDPDEPFTGRVAGPLAIPFRPGEISPGETAMAFFTAPDTAQLAKAGKPGDLLIGRIRYEPEPCPVSYPVTFVIPPAPTSPATSLPEPPDPRTLAERLDEERRDFETAQLSQLGGETNAPLFAARFEELRARYPKHTPLLAAKLHALDGGARSPSNLRAVILAAEEVVRQIDTNALAADLGLRTRDDDAAGRKALADRNRQRDLLVDALHRKARALARMAPHPIAANREFDDAFSALQAWADTTGEDFAEVQVFSDESHGRLGEALRRVRAGIASKPLDESLRREEIRLLERLAWQHSAANEKQWLHRRFPRDYAPF